MEKQVIIIEIINCFDRNQTYQVYLMKKCVVDSKENQVLSCWRVRKLMLEETSSIIILQSEGDHMISVTA